MEKLAKVIDMGDREGIKGYTLGFLHQRGQQGSGQLTGCRDQEGLGQGSEFRMSRAPEEKTAGDKRRSKREAASGTDPCHMIIHRQRIQRSCKERK